MAVYTPVGDDDLQRFLSGYAVGELLSAKGIAEGVENTNYLVRTTDGTFILTLYEQRVAVDDLPFFLGLMEHCAERGLVTPRPVHRRDGALLSELCGRAAALVTFLDGMASRRPGVTHCAELGRGLAKLHEAARDFPLRRANALGPDAWGPLFRRSREAADRVIAGLTEEVERELHSLLDAWPRTLPAGVIHADLFPDNVFFVGRRLSGIIDFYFACNDLLAYDLAICLNAWCFEEDGAFNVTKSQALIAGYAAARRLGEEELAALPILCRGAALRFMLTRLHDWLRVPEAALVRAKDPRPYFERLRFHRTVASVADYGLSASLPAAETPTARAAG